ncbi:hypothetical protein DSCO28_50650 [Desulfosarcina ovata subsp. sediminis]|uniref:Helix-turn-helix domain-containing protein n=1 Tax=Desulfosarcina ovata subsp. sediminis TaxID=885957 RepID=A0A5K7ZW70_9BACT|nr:hypothetical protein DSCO28_50650 [Desulfosarcina ovata subsp. sediminis]
MEKLYPTSDIAEACGVTRKWVQSLGQELIEHEHAQRVGKVLVCYESAIDYIKTRPDGRGRPKAK